MGFESVSLTPLKSFQPDRIQALEERFTPREIQLVLEDTDLHFNPTTRKIESKDGSSEYSKLSEVAAEAKTLLLSDRDGNLALDRLDTSDSHFLREASDRMKARWEPLAGNLAKLDAWYRFKPTLEAAKHYRLALVADFSWFAEYNMNDLAKEAGGKAQNPVDQFGDFIFENLRQGTAWALGGDILEAQKSWQMTKHVPTTFDPIRNEWVPLVSLDRLIHSPAEQRCQNMIGVMHYLKTGKNYEGPFGDFIQRTFVRSAFNPNDDAINPNNQSRYFSKSMFAYLSKTCGPMKPWLMEEWKMGAFSDHFSDLNLSPYPSLIGSDPLP
jgi:hypothetical protein